MAVGEGDLRSPCWSYDEMPPPARSALLAPRSTTSCSYASPVPDETSLRLQFFVFPRRHAPPDCLYYTTVTAANFPPRERVVQTSVFFNPRLLVNPHFSPLFSSSYSRILPRFPGDLPFFFSSPPTPFQKFSLLLDRCLLPAVFVLPFGGGSSFSAGVLPPLPQF